jgi:uncharacterized protein YndB with AHSA1/START domain
MIETKSSDAIRRTAHIKAPIDRVWRAISDHREFGEWFKVALDQPFEAGKPSTGRVTHPGFEHVKWAADIVAIEPPHRLAFRWHPYAVDQSVDYSSEPQTLVEFTLRERDGGTEVEVVESGFDSIPANRRDEAYRMNTSGWEAQMTNIRDHVEG